MKKLGIGITGSFCNLIESLKVYNELSKSYKITFFVSNTVQEEVNRFIKYDDYKKELLKIGDVKESISEAEKYGPFLPLDLFLLIILFLLGKFFASGLVPIIYSDTIVPPSFIISLNKLYLGIYDTPVLMATKAHLRTNKPVIVGIASNDYLGISGKNLFGLLNLKNIYLVE